MSALLTVERDKTEKVTRYLADARRMGIRVLAPSINDSGLDFQIQALTRTRPRKRRRARDLGYPFPVPPGSAIRYGIGAIKNVGEGAIETVLAARTEGGRFASLEEFCERVDLRQLNKRTVECLVKVGAFDEFADREKVLAVLDRMMQVLQQHLAGEGCRPDQHVRPDGFSSGQSPAPRACSIRRRTISPFPPKNGWTGRKTCSASTFPSIRWNA